MNESSEFRYERITRWLRVMMYIAIASLINSVTSFLPFVPASVTTWVSQGIMAGLVVCFFQLAPVNERYRKAGIMRTLMLVCTLINLLLYVSPILTLAASILSIIAVYQEYNAHSELAAEKNAKLSGKWHSLFAWNIVVGLLVSFGSTLTVLILAMQEMDAARLTSIIVAILSIPQLIFDAVYLTYIKKTINLFTESEVQ